MSHVVKSSTMIVHHFVSVFVIILSVCSCGYSQVGDDCTVRFNGKPGTCKEAVDCPVVEQQANNGITPTVCGFQYTANLIVCCEAQSVQPSEISFLNEDNPDAFVYPDSAESSTHSIMSKSRQKCDEYSKTVTDTVFAVPLITHPEQVSINVEKCDNNGVPLIVGGTPAAAGEFPFMAALGRYNGDNELEWFCGGTLVSDQYILTAAHCVRSTRWRVAKVRLGDLDLTKDDDGADHVDYDADEVKIHERYKPPKKYHDIALIRLTAKVEFTNFIRPACLWTQNTIEYNNAIATGWGKTDLGSDPSNKLLKVTLNILDNSVCSRTFSNNKALPDGIQSTMICAGELMGGKDTCQGDSGGPLIATKKGNQCIFYTIGITSFGKLICGAQNTPAVYTRVSEYIPWIENIIW